MDKNINLVESIERICNDLSAIFEKMKTVPGMYDANVQNHQKLCSLIPQQIREGVIKIAVVGTIKSGKSTFINSLLMDDLLKRGAGVVTSVVTRVKRGDTLRAEISFKSWDEINHEIDKALLFMPGCNMPGEPATSGSQKDMALLNHSATRGFDLRRKRDRLYLRTIKSRLCSGQYGENGSENLVVGEQLRPEAILISNVLDGYESVKGLISDDPDSSPVKFTADNFMEHKQFTGIGCNAFFVKDVLLEVPEADTAHGSSIIDPVVEIADCQGSDSTDSSHMAHIEDYLLSANMLVYLISSRSGLREADLKFLTIIQKMGILNNIFFIINTDFNEHDSLESLLELEKSVKEGLGYFIQNPAVYTVSALFNLFTALESSSLPDREGCSSKSFVMAHLSKRDSARLRQWQQESALVEYTSQSHKSFEDALKQKIKRELLSIMVENHIERLRIILRGTEQRNLMFMKLLSGDLKKVSSAAVSLKELQDRSRQFESLADDSIERVVERIKRDVFSAIKHFFDKKRGIQAARVREFIYGYAIYSDLYEEMISSSGFNHALYCMFQDFRSALDIFMARQFNPAVIELIQEQEHSIEREFQTLYRSSYLEPSKIYPHSGGGVDLSPLEEALISRPSYYCDGVDPTISKEPPLRAVDLAGAKRILGLALPKTSFATAYSAKIRFDAMARFSFYSLMELFGKVVSSIRPATPRTRALKESAKQIRKETLRSVMLHFDAYQNHVQSEYLSPLINAVARDFRDKLIDMFHMCEVESGHIEKLIADEQIDKSGKLEYMNLIVSSTDDIAQKINEIYITAMP